MYGVALTSFEGGWRHCIVVIMNTYYVVSYLGEKCGVIISYLKFKDI